MFRLMRMCVPILVSVALPAGAEQVVLTDTSSVESRLDRLEKKAAEQSQRIQQLQVDVEHLATPAPDQVRVAEVRKIVADMMSDTSFRESLFPASLNAGYAPMRGFYIDSPDEAFSLTIKGLLQVRYTGAARQSDNRNMAGRQKQDDINAFDIQSLYLAFFGHIGSPRLKYWLVVDGGVKSVGDGGSIDDGQWRTFYANISYEYATEQYITAGLFRLPFDAQHMTFDTLLQDVDRSLSQYAFAPDRSVGVMAHGNLLERRMTYFAAIANGVLNPADSPSRDELDTNFAYFARVAAYALGKGDSLIESRYGYPEGDLMYSKDPLLRFGMSFLYNDNNGDQGRGGPPFGNLFAAIPDNIRSGRGLGGSEPVSDIGTDVYAIGFDASFKYRGFSVNLDYYLRGIDGESKYSQWELHTLQDGATHQQGGNLQIGYFVVPKRFEVFGRLGGIWDNANDNTWEYGVGCNYYPYGTYNFRLAADIIRIDEVVGGAHFSPNYSFNDELTMIRVMLQVGF
jgi:hypothetical protein